jgi:hypothetical protein
MYTQTIKMPTQKDLNIVKIAVELTDQVPQLIEFNQKQPLTGIIQVILYIFFKTIFLIII